MSRAAAKEPELFPPQTATKTRGKRAPQVATSKGAVAVRGAAKELGPPPTPKSMLQALTQLSRDPSVSPDKIRDLLAIQERVMATEREQAFNRALLAAQAEMPHIVKTAKNKSTESSYAPLEIVARTVRPITLKHGISLSWSTAPSHLPNHYKEICYVSHVDGHTRVYEADVPADVLGPKGTPNKTPTHGFGSSMSYGRRYLLVMIFDLVLVGEDDDGNAAGRGGGLSEKQCADLVDALEAAGASRKSFLEWAEENWGGPFKRLDEIPAKHFATCQNAIASVRARRK